VAMGEIPTASSMTGTGTWTGVAVWPAGRGEATTCRLSVLATTSATALHPAGVHKVQAMARHLMAIRSPASSSRSTSPAAAPNISNHAVNLHLAIREISSAVSRLFPVHSRALVTVGVMLPLVRNSASVAVVMRLPVPSVAVAVETVLQVVAAVHVLPAAAVAAVEGAAIDLLKPEVPVMGLQDSPLFPNVTINDEKLFMAGHRNAHAHHRL
jgi:hypothetical protein